MNTIIRDCKKNYKRPIEISKHEAKIKKKNIHKNFKRRTKRQNDLGVAV